MNRSPTLVYEANVFTDECRVGGGERGAFLGTTRSLYDVIPIQMLFTAQNVWLRGICYFVDYLHPPKPRTSEKASQS
jgi:hypothetical protein